MPRYYTPQEANALLPQVRHLVAQIRQGHRAMADPKIREAYRTRARLNGGGVGLHAGLREAAALERALKQLQEWGCVLRDPETGLLDFPALRDGKEIWLCWLPEEEQVGFWHPTDTGFSERRRL